MLQDLESYRGRKRGRDHTNETRVEELMDDDYREWVERNFGTSSNDKAHRNGVLGGSGFMGRFNVIEWILRNDTELKLNYIHRLNEYLHSKTEDSMYYHWINKWIQNSEDFHNDLKNSETVNRIILNAPQLEQQDTVFRVITKDEQNPSPNPLENDRLMSCVYVSDDDFIKSWAIAWGSNNDFHDGRAWDLNRDTTKCCLLKFKLQKDVPRMYCVGSNVDASQAEVILPKNCAFYKESSQEEVWDLRKVKKFSTFNLEMQKYFQSLNHSYHLRRDDILHIKVCVVTYNVFYFQGKRRTPPR